MKLQDKCCTLEQGKRLVELGVPTQGVTFWHMPAKSGTHGECIRFGWHGDAIAPAFDVAELGELLPVRPDSNLSYDWYHRHNWRGHSVGYSEAGGKRHIETVWYKTEAEARAQLLIHLLENNLITFKPDTVMKQEKDLQTNDDNSFKCTCNNVAMGSQANALFVPPPKHFNSVHKGYWIDKCIFHEVMMLWAIGVATNGCCCGHGIAEPYIGVDDEFIQFMKDLGYQTERNNPRPNYVNHFYPIGEESLRHIISEKYFKPGTVTLAE
ncbi:hypothetical protein [Chitinophaga sancti]|uniref:Uncharacterized protein n=1 Tax=Chitinophaga sancti TaxID=1004 RepID=A0A1K1LZQ2_9BACT|nr:hypothetical protein [Chitinophaga sancti]WQD64732.1 hypothetical protein U0033_10025 [Chitinophaga sancti]WQG89646.1 hypothetical protein SR876_32450 [Chitinophaga sancti]SFW16345.1 hypothetical protein SAMN05661012_00338 [Chitinophaga sancti]